MNIRSLLFSVAVVGVCWSLFVHAAGSGQGQIQVVGSYPVDRSPGCWIEAKVTSNDSVIGERPDKSIGGYTPFEFLCHSDVVANIEVSISSCDASCKGTCCLKCKKVTGGWEKCPGDATLSVQLPDDRALPQLLELVRTGHELIWAAQTLTHFPLGARDTQTVIRGFLDRPNPNADTYENLARAELGLAMGKQSNIPARDRARYLLMTLTVTRFSNAIDSAVREAAQEMRRLTSEGPFITSTLVDYLVQSQTNSQALGSIVEIIMEMGRSCANCLLKLQQIERGEYRTHSSYNASMEGTAAYLLVHLIPLSSSQQANYLVRAIRSSDKSVAIDATKALVDYRDRASDVAFLLADMFEGHDSVNYRDDLICEALGELGPGARGAMPKIIERLKDRSPSNQRALGPCALAAGAMGSMGQEALVTLAELVKENSHQTEALQAMCAIEEASNVSPIYQSDGIKFSCQPPTLRQ
jgi:hypothetical protein